MKDWFKYKYGFVNIDDESIYFTTTGNWSETKKLDEKGIQKSSKFRKWKIQFFLIVSFLIGAFIIFMSLANGRVSLFALLGIPLGLFSIYNYLKPDIGENYKLPIKKITSINIEENKAVIEFKFLVEQNGTKKLENIEEKGEELLRNLKPMYHKT